MSAKKWISMVLSVAVVLLFFSPVIAAGTTDTIPTEAE